MAVAANAGWYTLPDARAQWPYGLRDTQASTVHIERLLSFPLVVLLGESDTDANHPNLRRAKRADEQGINRFQRGKHYYERGQSLAREYGVIFGWRLETVPDVGHSNSGMAERAAEIIATHAGSR